MENLTTLSHILENEDYSTSRLDYIKVKTVWSSKQSKRYCFIFLDTDGKHIGAVLTHYDHNSNNVYQMLKDEDCLFKINSFDVEQVNTVEWRILSNQSKQIRLPHSTLSIKRLEDEPPVFRHLPFHFTLLQNIDNHPEGSVVDIIGNVVNISEVLESSDGEVQYQRVKLSSSRTRNTGFEREVALFGSHLKTITKKNSVQAMLNVKIKDYEGAVGINKSLQTTGNTIILKIERDDLRRLPPAYHQEAFLINLFPKKRRSSSESPRVTRKSARISSLQEAKEENNFSQVAEIHTSLKPLPSSSTSGERSNIQSNTKENRSSCSFTQTSESEHETNAVSGNSEQQCTNAEASCTPSQLENQPFVIPKKWYNFVNNFDRFFVDVTKSTEYMDITADCYRMRSKPRGHALIMNNYHFPEKPGDEIEKHRVGSLQDVENLNGLLVRLGFEIELKNDVASEELPDVLDNFKNKFTSHMDACFVAVLSHGLNDIVEMVDNECVELQNDIIHQFDTIAFPIMAKKPKIFLVQACQDMPQDVQVTKLMPDRSQDVNLENIIVIKSTTTGLSAPRNPHLGSPFVHVFVDTLMEFSCKMDLVKMLESVQERLKNVVRKRTNILHCQWIRYHFNKKLYFNPGL